MFISVYIYLYIFLHKKFFTGTYNAYGKEIESHVEDRYNAQTLINARCDT